MNEENAVHIHTVKCFQLLKRNSFTCENNVDELGGHYAKGNNSVIEGQ